MRPEVWLPIKESGLVSALLPNLEDEVLDINMVQRMTDSGKGQVQNTVIVGKDGYIGLGEGKDVQVAGHQEGIDKAKLNLFKINRGCGSWDAAADSPHMPTSHGRGGSVRIVLMPAPGLGIAQRHCKKVMDMAGIKDIWTRLSVPRGQLELRHATYNALLNTIT